MKKLFVLFISLLSVLPLTSQVKYPLSKYPMYSNIWRMKYSDWNIDPYGNPVIVFGPKNYETFGDDSPQLNNVNLDKIQSLLITELNNFRKD